MSVQRSIFFDSFRDYLKLKQSKYLDVLILTSKVTQKEMTKVTLNENTLSAVKRLGIGEDEFHNMIRNPSSRLILMSLLAHELWTPYKQFR